MRKHIDSNDGSTHRQYDGERENLKTDADKCF